MRKIFLISFLFWANINFSQTVITTPTGVTITSFSADTRAHGLIGGQTYTHTATSWPSAGLKFGFPTTLPLAINGYNNLPPNSTCSGMTDVIYNSSLSNFANGIIVYTGTTNYRYLNTGGSYITSAVQVRVEIDFSLPAATFGSYIGVLANQNFNYNIIFKALSPIGALYFSPGVANTWTPAISLFDYLHTDPNSSICTSYNQGVYYSVCDDGIACTSDIFTFPTGCANTPNNVLCDDGINTTCEICSASSGCISNGLAQIWYIDSDLDGYGGSVISYNCTNPGAGYSLVNTDCNDAANAIHPGATEVCNYLDDDCDNAMDEGVLNSYYLDADNDTYGITPATLSSQFYSVQSASLAMVSSSGSVTNGPVCDDCTMTVPIGFNFSFYGNTYSSVVISSNGNIQFASSNPQLAALPIPAQDVLNNAIYLALSDWLPTTAGQITYYNLSNPTRFVVSFNNVPEFGSTGVLNGQIILYATGQIQLNVASMQCIAHSATTGVENATGTLATGSGLMVNPVSINNQTYLYSLVPGLNACSQPSGYVTNSTDCNDNNNAINPAATEVCNLIDDDCDTQIDEGTAVTPSVSIISNDADNSICDGTSVTFTATPTNGGSTPSYQWKVNGIDAGTNSTTFTTTTLANSDVVTVVMTANNTCQTASTATSNGITTTVTNNLTPSVTIAANTTDVCPGAGTSVTFTATPTNGGSTPSYQWKKNGTNVGTNSTTYTSTTLAGGDVITVVMTSNNICQTASTATSAETTINALTLNTYYLDNDGDGYGPTASGVSDCTQPSGYVTQSGDCDDNSIAVNPAATEVCNTIDDDCDGTADDGLTFVNYYNDVDGDTYGAGTATNACQSPGATYVTNNTDCDDNSSAVNPAATEVCNAIDDDCDGTADDGLTFVNYYNDVDGDTYGAGTATNACQSPGATYVTNNTDCNDNSNAVNPAATEVCNLIDDNCDTQIDENVQNTYYADVDGDNYGNATATTNACTIPSGYVSNDMDCNDNISAVNPATAEVCNLIDDNCDGLVDEGTAVTPSVTISTDAPSNTICEMNMVTFSSSLTNCGANPQYIWTIYGNDIDVHTPTYEHWAMGTGLFMLLVVPDNLCQTADTISSGWLELTVLESSYSSVTITSNTQAVCPGLGTSVTFTANPINAGSSPLYIWRKNGVDVGTNSPTYTSNSLVPGDEIYVFMLGSNTCQLPFLSDTIVIGAMTLNTYFLDVDVDGYGQSTSVSDCTQPTGYVVISGDCDDSNNAINPAATELCNNIDDDCNGSVDNGLTFVNYYNDQDGDSYGAGTVTNACQSPGASYVTNNTDCNDNNNAVNPAATEVCNGVDDDCNGTVDNGLTFVNYYNDQDGDTYGAGTATNACQSPGASYVTNHTDCNDNNSMVNPGATEICVNALDDNCNGLIDENCVPSVLVGDEPILPIPVGTINQYGMGVQYSVSVNLTIATNSISAGSIGKDMWYQFTAQHKSVRVSLKGSSVVGDDNRLLLYNYVTSPAGLLIPIDVENDVHPGSQGLASDGGDEIMYYSNLQVGQTYWVCVQNTNANSGSCILGISYLKGSQTDIGPYTNYTGIYNNTCSNFKSAYRYGAYQYTVKRHVGSDLSSMVDWIYTIPNTGTTTASTVCQLGKILPANLGTSAQTYYVSIDVQYNMKDAYGNDEQVNAEGILMGAVILNPESNLYLRTSDQCPVFKSVTSSIATNRSVCGTQQYNWNFTMVSPTMGLPINVDGPMGGSRTMAMSSITGIANGQRYDVKIRSKHVDGATYSSYGTVKCVKTLGAAGMVLSEEGVTYGSEESGIKLYPNPNDGSEITVYNTMMEGWVTMRVIDAQGREVERMEFESYPSAGQSMRFNKPLSSGLYQLEFIQGNRHEVIRMSVGR